MASNFIWYELITTDTGAAARFYGKVVGWTIAGQTGTDAHGGAYRMWEANGTSIGGLMKQPDMAAKAGMPPSWQGYIHVEDVDATLAAITAVGGKKWMDRDAPGVGRIALVSDPQGASFYVMKPIPTTSGGVSRAFEPGTPGHIGWNEYHGKDGEAAFAFYTQHFGWAADGEVDMGPMGKYRLFKIGGVQTGGIMTDANFPHPAWTYYIMVEDIDAAKGRVESSGGRILYGPQQVPGGQYILNCQDPQGAMFSLVGPKK
jgi:predicted enzyme related to lactoylglutathione lyase